MEIFFITTNKHKVKEAAEALKEFGISVKQHNASYPEDKEGTIHDLVRKAVKPLAEQHKKPVVIEDTGLFFEAYKDFPGLFPKFIFNSIGYEGIFHLLEGKSRKAFFLTIVGYCEPGKEPVLFEGRMHGRIDTEVHNIDKDSMPYDRIFIRDGYDVTVSDLSLAEKTKFSQRAEAFRRLGRFLRLTYSQSTCVAP